VHRVVDVDLPDERELVDVILDSATEPLVATVAEVSGDVVVIEAPANREGRLVFPQIGEGGLLVWRGGPHPPQAPMTAVDTSRRPRPQWRMRVIGPPLPCQRRAFVRADMHVPAILHIAEGSRPVTALDISEGGLRCSAPSGTELGRGDSVRVELDLDGAEFTFSAEVVRVKRGDEDRPNDFSLRFTDLSIRDADRIRGYIFGAMKQRRAQGLV